MGCMVKAKPRPLYPWGKKTPSPIAQEAENAQRPVWTGAGNLVSTIRIRSSDSFAVDNEKVTFVTVLDHLKY